MTRRSHSSGRAVVPAENVSQLTFAFLVLLALFAGCSSTPATTEKVPGDFSRSRYLMGTICEVTVPSPHAERIDDAFDEIDRIERRFSTWRSDSDLSSLNLTKVSSQPELYGVIERAMAIARTTGGAFNPLVGPLLRAWQTRAEGRVPSADELKAALGALATHNVVFRDGSVMLEGGAEIEEGAFAKGYAIDRAAEVLEAAGVSDFVVNFGGQLSVGSEPREVAIAHPVERQAPALRLKIRDASLSTSAGSEKTFIVDGRTFTHLFDPRTGEALPPRGSVSVLADAAFDADALSTALYVMGPDSGLQWANAHGVAALFLVPLESSFVARRSDEFQRRVADLAAVHHDVILSKGTVSR